MTTMTSLRDEIGAAMEKGQWYSTHKLQHINVKDIVDELLLALSGMLGDNKSLFNRISRWLEREFMSRSIYVFLDHFSGLFDRMVKTGADETSLGILIDALAAVPKDSEEQPDVSVADVVSRTAFRKSPLYASFVAHRTSQLLQRAKGAMGE